MGGDHGLKLPLVACELAMQIECRLAQRDTRFLDVDRINPVSFENIE